MTLQEFKTKTKWLQQLEWSDRYNLEFFWSFPLSGPSDKIWTYLSDTSRFNRAIGMSARTEKEIDGKRLVQTKLLGMPQEWVEEPWNWHSENTLSASRIYKRGIARSFFAVFHIEKGMVYIYFGWEPKNWFSRFFLKATEAYLKNQFAKVMTLIETSANRSNDVKIENIFQKAPDPLTPVQLANLEKAITELKEKNIDPNIVTKLRDYILKADEFDLESIRLVNLARTWGMDLDSLLRACLHATRASLLNLTWNVICPHCRGPRFTAKTLGDLPESAHCDACDIDFSTDRMNSVEVIFTVHPSIREVKPKLYCSGEPAKKAHILLQRSMLANELFRVDLDFAPGIYKIRQQGVSHKIELQVIEGLETESLKISSHSESGVKIVPRKFSFEYKNELAQNSMLVIEKSEPNADVLRPQDIFLLGEFRELFSEEHLSSNVKLHLGEQSLLFTDMVGSTRYYEKVGDAKAFEQVRNHFQEIFQEVQNHHGGVVKTVGDAVMAAFPTSTDALKAALKIQQRFHKDRKDTPIQLRISVHSGPVIAVHVDTGIDYFGSTVNRAAKIQAFAKAGDIAICEDLKPLCERISRDQGVEGGWVKREGKRDSDVPVDVFVFQTQAAKAEAA